MQFPSDNNVAPAIPIENLEIAEATMSNLTKEEFQRARAEARADPKAINVGDSDLPDEVDVRITAAWGGGGMHNVVWGDGKELSRGTVVVGHLLQFLAPEEDQVAWLEEVGRYRDCWLEEIDGHQRIAVLTRLGNLVDKEGYAEMVHDIRKHELFLDEHFSKDDHSYLTFYFDVPTSDFFEDPDDQDMIDVVVESLVEDRLSKDGDLDPINWDERWEAFRTPEAPKLMEPLIQQVIAKLLEAGYEEGRPVNVPLGEDNA